LGILFISHSSQDNDAAIKVRDWLKENGWGQVFLDIDPAQGLAPGHQWQQELKKAGERCSGVLVLVSPHWVASRWCQAEFLVADQLGKTIFPVIVAPVAREHLPPELTGRFQFADISVPETEKEGFERLAVGLKRAGLDPNSFPWPPADQPNRSIYRGLQTLEEQDAAIFFGRDALITKGLDALRRMREGAPERMLVIFGPSGAGKSSFLRAGLIARLRRDEENFIVPPVIRPERAALTGNRGLAASLGRDAAELGGPQDLADAFAALRAPVIARRALLTDAGHENDVMRPPTIVIAIDQAEELFTADNAEAAQTLDLIAAAIRLDADTIVVATIRSDSLALPQSEPRLAEIARLPFDLPPISVGAMKEIIEGPARLANPPLSIEHALTERLLKDLNAADALPLLAFTLERLTSRHRDRRSLTLSDYVDDMGGLQGAITGAVETAFANALNDPALPNSRVELEALARAAFIPALVLVDDAAADPKRRIERLSAFPDATRAFMRHLIDQRILVSDHRKVDGEETPVVEVAHEAILRQWPTLRSWIAEERDALRTLDSVRVAASEWRLHTGGVDSAGGDNWLVHRGTRLAEAEALTGRPGFAATLGQVERDYLTACRAAENADLTRERRQLARTRRLQSSVGILIAAAAVIVLLAGTGIVLILAGLAQRTSDTLAELAGTESAAGRYDLAARYAIAGLAAANAPLVGYRSEAAEAELRGAVNASMAIAALHGHEDTIASAVFSPDGTRILTASFDRTARIWDVRTGKELSVLRGHDDVVVRAAFNADGTRIITASADKTARIWDVRTGHEYLVLRGHDGAVSSAAFSPDDTRVVTASADGTARIWDAGTGREVVVLRGHDGAVTTAAFSRDGMRVVTASADKTGRIWDTASGRQTAVLQGHDGSVSGAVFSPDGTRIVTASFDKTARVWDAMSGHEIAVLRGHKDFVTGAAYSPDGSRIVTASSDKTARIWDAESGREVASLNGHEGAIESAAFSLDGTRIVTASSDRTARIWDAAIGSEVVALRGHEGAVSSAAYNPDGTRIVTASFDQTARVWDAAKGSEIAVLRGHQDLVTGAAFSPDGTRIVTASFDKTARIWDAQSGREIASLRGHEGGLESAAYSPDGKRIVTASDDKTVRVWDAESGREIVAMHGHEDLVFSAMFSPDGNRIVTASSDKTARIWDARTGRELTVARGHEGGVSSAAFSPDGTRIVTASDDKTARIWNAQTGSEIAVLRGHQDLVISAAYSPDGTRIATASYDKTARIWDAGNGHEIAALRGHDDRILGAAFSPDGTRIVTASYDTTARIWPLKPVLSAPRDELVRGVCQNTLALGLRQLSPLELRRATVLDPNLDGDPCDPPGVWARLVETVWATVHGREN
jgi:WD40 repeat protein